MLGVQNRGPLHCAAGESAGTRAKLEIGGAVPRVAEAGSAAPPRPVGRHDDGVLPERESAHTGLLEREAWVVLFGRSPNNDVCSANPIAAAGPASRNW